MKVEDAKSRGIHTYDWFLIDQGLVTRPRADDDGTKVGDLFARFLDAPRRRPLAEKTRREYQKWFGQLIGPPLGARPVKALNRADVVGWIERLQAEGETPSQIEHAYRLLRATLSFGVDLDLIPHNPAQRLNRRVPKHEPRPGKALSAADLARLAHQVPGADRPMVWLMGVCGLRIGEVVALKARHLNPERRTLVIEEAQSDGADGATKTRTSRIVPVPQRVWNELRSRVQDKPPDTYVFSTTRGHRIRSDNWRNRVFRPAAQRAGLAGVTPHDLRRTARSLAETAGASPEEARALGGWSSHDMSRHYLRVYADRLERVVDEVDRLIAPEDETHHFSEEGTPNRPPDAAKLRA